MTRTARWFALALGAALMFPACDDVVPADASVDAQVVATDAGTSAPPDAGAPPEDFDGFVEWYMEYGGIPGAALAIVTPDEVVRYGTYGYADIESERAVDEHTLFIMASISKTFAVVRAMQLVEAGALELDEPVETYLGYPLEHPEHTGVDLTTRMLLSHVSGLEDNFVTLAGVTYQGDPPLTLDEFTRAYAVPGGAIYDPGHWGPPPLTERSYCNAAYGVVGAVLEGAGGAPLPAQTEAELFEPLALDGAGWLLADVELERVATPYGYNGRRFSALPHNGFAYYPASSLRISITGLARFAQMIMRGGELDGERVLSDESVDEMLRTQFPEISSGQALGFSQRRNGGERFIGHSGATFGGSTQLLIALERTHAVILITNSDAHIRARVASLQQGEEAIDAILARMDAEIR